MVLGLDSRANLDELRMHCQRLTPAERGIPRCLDTYARATERCVVLLTVVIAILNFCIIRILVLDYAFQLVIVLVGVAFHLIAVVFITIAIHIAVLIAARISLCLTLFIAFFIAFLSLLLVSLLLVSLFINLLFFSLLFISVTQPPLRQLPLRVCV